MREAQYTPVSGLNWSRRGELPTRNGWLGAPNSTYPLIGGEPPHIEPFTITPVVFMADMSQPSTLQALFNAALQDYKDKTGNSLSDHPFAKQLQECDSVESISTILEDQAQIFREFRDHGKLINSLKRLADILSSPFITTVGEGIGLVVRPKAFVTVCYC